MKYRKKPVEFGAFQMIGERHCNNVDWPAFLHRAWNSGMLHSEHKTVKGHLLIRECTGNVAVKEGDWIVQTEIDGVLTVLSDKEFKATYEEVQCGD